uniref:Transposase n=1 Tax=Romanomermis culicivorax TaxID=13658 RepID=A0A915IFH8_ROMCU
MCIRRRLIPYIRQNHRQGDYIFWPDQASSHYAKIVLDHLQAENIEFVKKCDNPANVLEVPVIEDFWAYLKSLVYVKGWEAKNLDQLSNRIKHELLSFSFNFKFKAAFRSTSSILLKFSTIVSLHSALPDISIFI